MKNIKFTYVDSVTQVSVAKEPARHGPAFPAFKGLKYSFARESLYPTHVPLFIGTCDNDADLTLDGFIEELDDDGLQKERGYETDFQAQRIRSQRNIMLAECDWTQVIDAPVNQAAWATYRQALRDITAQAGFPWTIEWPEQP